MKIDESLSIFFSLAVSAVDSECWKESCLILVFPSLCIGNSLLCEMNFLPDHSTVISCSYHSPCPFDFSSAQPNSAYGQIQASLSVNTSKATC